MLNLNDDSQFQNEGGIFNGGVAGEVKGVSIKEVHKKTSEDKTNSPDYKVVFTDGAGDVNVGFYYKPSNYKDDEDLARKQGFTIGRVREIAKALLDDEKFPEVSTAEEAIDVMMKFIDAKKDKKKVNVFVTYGNKNRASKYLQLRFFNFVQPEGSEVPLLARPDDLLEQITPDTSNGGLGDMFGGTSSDGSKDSGMDWMS